MCDEALPCVASALDHHGYFAGNVWVVMVRSMGEVVAKKLCDSTVESMLTDRKTSGHENSYAQSGRVYFYV